MSDRSRTETRAEYAELARALMARLVDRDLLARDRLVIGIAGESGSGKSVTAMTLARALEAAGHPALVLHQDDYFHLPPRINHAAREALVSRVGPDEVNLLLLQSHVAAYRSGSEGVEKPETNYATDRFEMRHVAFGDIAVLLIEGTYVLGLVDLDLRIFLAATYSDTRDRRRVRARDVDSAFVERVLAIEHDIIASQSVLADLVVDVHFRITAEQGR